jgi:hypothetical protein
MFFFLIKKKKKEKEKEKEKERKKKGVGFIKTNTLFCLVSVCKEPTLLDIY